MKTSKLINRLFSVLLSSFFVFATIFLFLCCGQGDDISLSDEKQTKEEDDKSLTYRMICPKKTLRLIPVKAINTGCNRDYDNYGNGYGTECVLPTENDYDKIRNVRTYDDNVDEDDHVYYPIDLDPCTGLPPSIVKDKLKVKLAQGERGSASFVIRSDYLLRNVTVRPQARSFVDTDVRWVKAMYRRWLPTTHDVLHPQILLKDDGLVTVVDGVENDDLCEQINGKSECYNKLRVAAVSNNLKNTYVDTKKYKYYDISSEKACVYDNWVGPGYNKDPGNCLPKYAVFKDSDESKPLTKLAKQHNKQVWLTVHVDEDTAPGTYSQRIYVSGKRYNRRGRPRWLQIRDYITLEIKVLPFPLEKPVLDYSIYYHADLYTEHTDDTEDTEYTVTNEIKYNILRHES